ncbi:fasciclin-2-like isoform X2 [Cylas formicarius]|uniref:fasciclin-2-like isoform X2 n=1 Tax=Cylas formicarius TaxID=197179 RepID=UPI002958D90E|nr:fasciclin-2-like isoform X2 [Cylas formicarius]
MGLWFVYFAVVGFAAVHGQEAYLQIQPRTRIVRKEVGGTLALTCRPIAPKPALVTQLEWRDPRGRRIDILNKASPIYVQSISGDTGLMLMFTELNEQQQGNYSCHASYATEPLTAEVEVSTFDEVEFVDAPESQYPIAGKDYLIRCKVKGNPKPFVDWFKGEALINNSEKYIRTNDGLVLNNVTELDDGVYKCSAIVVETGAYKIRSIKVEVQVPPKISPIEPISVVEGETASAQCSATGKPPPTYTWIKLDRRNDLSKTDRFDVKRGTGELIMNRVEFGDDGLYKCIAENPAGRVETTIKINVLVKPRIYELLNVTSPESNETRITCKAYGRPPPRVTFRKLGHTEPFRSGPQPHDPRINLEQTVFEEKGEGFGTLMITNLSRSDDGLYECKAENPTSSAFKNGHITVHFKPTFNRTKDLPPVWSWAGRPGNLSCLPEAIPNATITWRYRGVEISEENFNNGRVSRNNFRVQGTSPQSFLIVNTYDNKLYYTHYECIARNALGEASTKIELKKGEVPRAVNQVRRVSLTATTIKFSIVPPTDFDGLPVKSYTIQYKPERQPTWDNAMEHTWSVGAPYILENLIPEVTYLFRVAARNDVGLGTWTNMESVTMPRRSEPAEPTILLSAINQNVPDGDEVVSPFSNHFEVRWNVPADNGEPIQYYTIRFCITDRTNGGWIDRDCSEPLHQSIQYTNYQLDQLFPDTVYKIELRAHNAIGDSSPAQIRVRTARGTNPQVQIKKPAMSSSMIIGIVIGAILIVLIVVDVTCFLVNRTGLIALCCEQRKKKKKKDEEDPKYGSYKAAPAHPNSLNLPQPIKLAATPTEEQEPLKQELEKPVSLEFDGRHVYSKTGEMIGKHSAV